MADKTWPVVVGVGLITLSVMLALGAFGYYVLSGFSGGPTQTSVVVFGFAPLVASTAAVTAGVVLLRRARPRAWVGLFALGLVLALVVALLYLYVLPELVYPDA